MSTLDCILSVLGRHPCAGISNILRHLKWPKTYIQTVVWSFKVTLKRPRKTHALLIRGWITFISLILKKIKVTISVLEGSLVSTKERMMWLEFIANVLNILITIFIHFSGIFWVVLVHKYIEEIRNIISWQYNFSDVIVIREA